MTANVSQPPSGQRFAFVHGLRGVAALLVVWSHLSGFWLLTTGNTSVLQRSWQDWVVGPFHLYQNGGHLGVILFFLISGYIITHTSLRESKTSFAVKRSLRIFPPLILATFICWIMLRISAATNTTLLGVNDGSMWHWLRAGVLLDAIHSGDRALDVTWTLVIELAFYVLTFALLGMSRTRPLRSTWIMIGVWLAATPAAMNLPHVGPQLRGLPVYVGVLLVGRVIYLGQQRRIDVADAAVAGAALGLAFLVLQETLEPGILLAPGGWHGIEPLVTYVLAPLIFIGLMRMAPSRVLQPFRLLGDVSYSLYLLHLPIGITVLNLLHKRGGSESVNVLIAIVVSVAVSWVAYRLVEVPSQRLARRLLAKRRSDELLTSEPGSVAS